MTFKTPGGLQKHLQKQWNLVCLHCQQGFCSRDLLQQHLNSIDREHGTVWGPEILDRNRPIQPRTGFEDDEGFKAVVKNNILDIQDQETISKNCITINKQIDPAFTYSDLGKIITDIYTTQKRAFNFNLDSVLYCTIQPPMSSVTFTTAVTICDSREQSPFPTDKTLKNSWRKL